MVFKEDIGIPMDIDPAPFLAIMFFFFFFFFESRDIQKLTSKKSNRA